MLVVAVVIANTLLMSVFERIREMGILASLGMKGRQIMTMILIEAVILGVIGIVHRRHRGIWLCRLPGDGRLRFQATWQRGGRHRHEFDHVRPLCSRRHGLAVRCGRWR